MKWMNLAVQPGFSWPNCQVELEFEGRRLVLQPMTDELACTVSVFDHQGLSFEEGGSILCRFLSRLAWSRNGGVVELFFIGSNNPARPGSMGRGTYGTSGWAAVQPWDYLYLPVPRSAEAELALALYREGLSVNSVPFSFLSFFKILNIRFSAGASQKDWINRNQKALWCNSAVDRLKELQRSESDIGAYLYHQGRCAVAHANGSPVVNPDLYGDKRRLELDLPLIKEITAHFIEKELGVLSDSSFWKRLRGSVNGSPELLRKTENEDGRVVYVEWKPKAQPMGAH